MTGILTEQKFTSDYRYRVIDSSSIVSVLFREVFSHPYISFFHLLVNVVFLCYANKASSTVGGTINLQNAVIQYF